MNIIELGQPIAKRYFENIQQLQNSFINKEDLLINKSESFLDLNEKEFDELVEKGQTDIFTIDNLIKFVKDVCDSKDEKLIEKAKKDINKLQKVTKTVMRGGKSVNTTYYVKPKQSEVKKQKKGQSKQGDKSGKKPEMNQQTVNGMFIQAVKNGITKQGLQEAEHHYSELSHINKIRFEREWEKTMGEKYKKETVYGGETKDRKEEQKTPQKKQKRNVKDMDVKVDNEGNVTYHKKDSSLKKEEKPKSKAQAEREKPKKHIDDHMIRNEDGDKVTRGEAKRDFHDYMEDTYEDHDDYKKEINQELDKLDHKTFEEVMKEHTASTHDGGSEKTPEEFLEHLKKLTSKSKIEKGRKSYPIGTIHNGYKKVAEGKWQKVSEYGMTKKEHQQKQLEHLDNASNAQKNNDDARLRTHTEAEEKHAKLASKLDNKEYSDKDVGVNKKEIGKSKVIGHTTSGKPIYDNKNPNAGHKFQNWTKQDHLDASDSHQKMYENLNKKAGIVYTQNGGKKESAKLADKADQHRKAKEGHKYAAENWKFDKKEVKKSEDTKELIKEHKKLVKVLESPSHKDDKKEAKKQKKELKQYQAKEEVQKAFDFLNI